MALPRKLRAKHLEDPTLPVTTEEVDFAANGPWEYRVYSWREPNTRNYTDLPEPNQNNVRSYKDDINTFKDWLLDQWDMFVLAWW